jgi:hypothetical protein
MVVVCPESADAAAHALNGCAGGGRAPPGVRGRRRARGGVPLALLFGEDGRGAADREDEEDTGAGVMLAARVAGVAIDEEAGGEDGAERSAGTERQCASLKVSEMMRPGGMAGNR